MIGEHGCQSGPGLIGEALIGARLWGCEDDGWLRGVSFTEPWPPLVMTASCYRTKTPGGLHANHGVRFPEGYAETFPLHRLDPCANRLGANGECGHGIYARWGDRLSEYNSRTTPFALVAGVIRGFGRVLVGPDGFKCEKARIIALHLPGVRDDWHHLAREHWGHVRARIVANYPNARVFVDADVMYEAFPPSDPSPLLEAS